MPPPPPTKLVNTACKNNDGIIIRDTFFPKHDVLSSSADPLLFTFLFVNSANVRKDMSAVADMSEDMIAEMAADAVRHTFRCMSEKSASNYKKKKGESRMSFFDVCDLGTMPLEDRLALGFHLVSETDMQRSDIAATKAKHGVSITELHAAMVDSGDHAQLALAPFMVLCEFEHIPVICIYGNAYFETDAASCNSRFEHVHIIFCSNKQHISEHTKPVYAYGGIVRRESDVVQFVRNRYYHAPAVKKVVLAISKMKIVELARACECLHIDMCSNDGKTLKKMQMVDAVARYFEYIH